MFVGLKDAKALFDGEMTTAAVVSKVEEIEKKAGLMAAFIKNDKTSGSSMVTLTGWIALAAMAALIVVLISGVVFAYADHTSLWRSRYISEQCRSLSTVCKYRRVIGCWVESLNGCQSRFSLLFAKGKYSISQTWLESLCGFCGLKEY